VLFDLIVVLVPALLVGLLPGYFWSLVLFHTPDRAERLAYSAALSVALVPVVALVAARPWGGGVTLPIAVLSPLVVLGAGLAVYLRFGPSKGPDEPLAATPGPLGLATLAPVAAALALVLGSNLVSLGVFWLAASCQGWPSGVCEQSGAVQRFLIPVALLLLAGGMAHLLASRRKQAPEGQAEEPSIGDRGPASDTASRLLLPAVLLVVLARGYLGPVLHDWPFVRGLDHYSHAVMTNLVMSEGSSESYLIYPPGFHAMTAIVSRLSGLDPLEIFPVLGPALMLLPTLALYTLAKSLWGWEYGVAAAFLGGVVLGGTYYYLNDAMYPNLVASQFLMVLAIAALLRMYSRPSVRGGLLLALLGSSVVLYHQVSSLYLALLLAVVGMFFVPYLLLRDRARGVALLLSLALLGVLSVAYAWDTYDLGGAVVGLLGGSGGTTGDAVGMAVGTQAPYGLGYLIGAIVSQPVAWLGLLGAVLMAAALRGRSDAPRVLAWATLVAWALLLFVGSRTAYSGFPQRFGRDLGVPLALLAALALVTVLRSLLKQRGSAAVLAASLAVFLVLSLTGLRAAQTLAQASSPSPHLTMTEEISAAGEWLEGHNEGGNIIVSPQGNQVPSRMMLAMGDYSALQSFTEKQIENPRDLPPSGKGPMQDVLWTMHNPVGERTDEILDRYDVRYIVLYKDMPNRGIMPWWRLFDARPDRYRQVFENDDVLIVEPRRPSGS
jgi:hypothetical protein